MSVIQSTVVGSYLGGAILSLVLPLGVFVAVAIWYGLVLRNRGAGH